MLESKELRSKIDVFFGFVSAYIPATIEAIQLLEVRPLCDSINWNVR